MPAVVGKIRRMLIREFRPTDLEAVVALFTSPAHVRLGVAKALHDAARDALADLGVIELFTEASEVARPFFEKQGYEVVHREVVQIRGSELLRYRMRCRVT